MELEVLVEVVMAPEVVEMEGRVVDMEVRQLDIVVEMEVEGGDSVAVATVDLCKDFLRWVCHHKSKWFKEILQIGASMAEFPISQLEFLFSLSLQRANSSLITRANQSPLSS